MDAVRAEAARRKIFDMSIADRIPIIGFHWSFPSRGYIRPDGKGRFALVPSLWQA
jgi:hypothetical protein